MSVLPRISPEEKVHGLRRKAVAEHLLREIVGGRLNPGQHLVTRELAERFGVSHTPIREALAALAGVGVVDLVPNRGAIVRRLTPVEVKEICHVRRALECEAVRAACGRIEPVELDVLSAELKLMVEDRTAADERRIGAARALDSRLHDLIAASCGNGFLVNELDRLKALFRAFRDASWERVEGRDDTVRLVEEATEHLAVVEALRARDRNEATRAMSRHILAGKKYWGQAPSEPEAKSLTSPSSKPRRPRGVF